jgi:endoglucanase
MTSGFYVDPYSNPKDWVNKNPGEDANLINAAIASKPMARWFGNWNANIADAVHNHVGPADTAAALALISGDSTPAG